MAQVTTTEVKITANAKHRGIVDIKLTDQRDEKGNAVAPNGIRWNLSTSKR